MSNTRHTPRTIDYLLSSWHRSDDTISKRGPDAQHCYQLIYLLSKLMGTGRFPKPEYYPSNWEDERDET